MELLNDDSKHSLAMDRPRADYFNTQHTQDPFSDPFLIGPTECTGIVALTRNKIQELLIRARENGFSDEHWDKVEWFVWKHVAAFGFRFSAAPSKVDLLCTQLKLDTKPVCVEFRNYSASQQGFKYKIIQELFCFGLVNLYCRSRWASVSIIFPKPGPAEWLFTVGLSPVDQFFLSPPILHASF